MLPHSACLLYFLFLPVFSPPSCHVQLTAGLVFLQLLPTCEQSQCCEGHFGDLISQTSLLATRKKNSSVNMERTCSFKRIHFVRGHPKCSRRLSSNALVNPNLRKTSQESHFFLSLQKSTFTHSSS